MNVFTISLDSGSVVVTKECYAAFIWYYCGEISFSKRNGRILGVRMIGVKDKLRKVVEEHDRT